MPKQESWSKLKNILCVRPDNIGDVIMTTPAIRALKNAEEGRRITLLASKAGSGIARYIPEVDEIIEYDPFWVKNDSQNGTEEFNQLLGVIRNRQFDGAVIFTVYSQNPLPSAMLCYLAGIPNIAGYCRENPYQLMNYWLPDKEPLFEVKHEVKRQLELTEFLGCSLSDDMMSLQVSNKATNSVKMKLEQWIQPENPFLIVHPGVSESRRQYPVDDFGSTANLLMKEGYQVLLTGSKAERVLTDYIQEIAGIGVQSIAGELTLEEMIALVKLSPVIISNNTGPVHIAAAVGTPVVVLYALTNPQHTPWKVPNVVLPFEVPEKNRSKNTIVSYTHKKYFNKQPRMPQPKEIVAAVKKLLLRETAMTVDEMVRL